MGILGGGAAALVMVDDLAVGDVPDVCVKTGDPADFLVPVEGSDGGARPWWLLLLLLGPVGVVAVVLLWALARRQNRISGRLPVSVAAADRYNRAVRAGRLGMAVGAAGLAVGVGLLLTARGGSDLGAVGGAVAVLAIATGVLVHVGASMVARWLWVDLELDGSGRWVAVRGAHPSFAMAVQESYRRARSLSA